ncbi:hypothetical protein [Paraburkholderia terrae]|uniref:Uncharacterized protein n=1 Tax=Paraburkholderia terrae TaxID=311230 RepID=A0A2I8ETI1_9BURK|nr:hypothetical protein [Paraburkholderia terrae]AUT62907.1 hypothetical protein C2L65_25390 [Paraburkholderia terrae]
MYADPVVRVVTRRQQAWRDAHERAEQSRTGDVFGWWLLMRVQGRIDGDSETCLRDALRAFNVVQVTPLPHSGE